MTRGRAQRAALLAVAFLSSSAAEGLLVLGRWPLALLSLAVMAAAGIAFLLDPTP